MQVLLTEPFSWAILRDELAFKAMYRQCFVKLYRYAFSLVRNKESAEEIVHDVLINLWRKRNNFTEVGNLNTYLYVSVKNLSLNYIRNEARHKHIDIERLYDENCLLTVDPESIFINKEQLTSVQETINALPTRCRIIFKLVKIDGLKYKEVAGLLDISIKTVESQMTIAIKKIAKAHKIFVG